MNSAPATAESLLEFAWSALDQDDRAGAEAICRQALQLAPANVVALGLLGYILHSSSRFMEAAEVYAKATQLAPDDPSHWMNLGTARRCAQQFDEALAAYTQAAACGANSADFFFNVGLAHIDRNDFESGRAVLTQAAQLEPRDAEIRYHLALCCYERLRTDEALGALDDWEKFERLSNEVVANIGLLLMKLGEPERAEPAVRQAVAAAGSDAHPLLTLVQLLERTNRLAEAQREMRELTANPGAASLGSEYMLMQAQLAQRSGQHAAAIDLFAGLLAQCKEDYLKHLLQFPLAKSLDAVGRYDEAFAMLVDAHRSQAELLHLTAPIASARGAPTMAITRFSSDPEDIAAWSDKHAPKQEDSPVFVVAFPRSGTTLLELTLDAHPQLVSMDEQPFVQNALDDMIGAGARYPDRLRSLDDAQIQAIRARYWERTRRKVVLGAGQRLVDKNPLNILRLPAIKRLFPNAPVILAIRHPCDVLLSCFMQHFRTPDFALLCRDLSTLAFGYRRSFDYWYAQKELLDPISMELRYETFVAQFDDQIRGILDFLGLPWSEAVLEPQRNAQAKKFISTPSYAQVLEPVNSKAVGRWRAYQSHFSEIMPILAPYLLKWGYDG